MNNNKADLPLGEVRKAACPRPETVTANNAVKAERRRAGLRHFLKRRGLSPTALAHLIGLPTPNLLYNHLNRRSASLGAVRSPPGK